MAKSRALVLSVLGLLVTVLATVAIVGLTSHRAGADPTPTRVRYADYLNPGNSNGDDSEQCDKPVSERVGGWFCYEDGGSSRTMGR